MTPRLHDRYARDILNAERIDPQSELVQRRIEEYSPESGLDADRLEYIQRLQRRYNDLRDSNFDLRYYQILALYFTEHFYTQQADRETDERNMLAYWMATGSGKTLIMHVNLLQHLDYLEREGIDYDRLEVVLTTPGVNLIEQHREEFAPFVEAVNEHYAGRLDLRIDTTQALLQHDEDYFNIADEHTRRIVFVDEGHIGLSSTKEGEFKKLRDEMNKKGRSFLFEYSATYHNLGSTELEREYEDAIVYDYNYARFYDDGYGKDYFFKRIGPNVTEQSPTDNLDQCFGVLQEKYEAYRTLTGLPQEEKNERFPANPPLRPLLALMGGTVSSGKRNKSDEEVLSDVEKVLRYLADMPNGKRRRLSHVFGGDVTGPLRLTRNQDVEDEILLSYGDGEKWGLINVSGGDKFFSDLELEDVQIEKRTDPIGEERHQFQHIDEPDCPINVLIGSRKFSEGWNCFRLSVIGLINLGSAKGNQIIQIFGRGVRLHGAKQGEGKRTAEVFEDRDVAYPELGQTTSDHVRRLETLTVYSLKPSYLRTFIDELKEDVPPRRTFTLKVEPTCITLGSGETVEFKDYQDRLPIFKMRDRKASHLKVVLQDGTFEYEHLNAGGTPETGNQDRFRFSLDYRTDRDSEGHEVEEDVRNRYEELQPYLDRARLTRLVQGEAKDAQMLLYARRKEAVDESETNGEATGEARLRPVHFADLLPFVENIRFGERLHEADIETVDLLARQITKDAVRKLKNRVRYLINRNNYLFEEPPRQSSEDEKRDFLYQYVVTKEFDTQEALESFEEDLEKKRSEIRTKLSLGAVPPHIYEPLLDEPGEGNRLSISPDKLNAGEKKFVKDLSKYVDDQFSNQERYEFYLLRNVESLRSIGIYLENDEQAYFPDFVLWIKDREAPCTHVLFADPKGQRGLNNPATREDSEKVKIAQKNEEHPALLELEEQLSETQDEPVTLHSFILLRDSSPFGRQRGPDFAREEMLPYNLLRLDWHARKEGGSTSHLFDDEKSYLDLMFEEIGLTRPEALPQ